MRKIIHLDMDCFYAAVEMRERPELVGRPLAVGGGSRRGVVTTCNYEARKFGVHSAMPGFKARELCPQLIFLPVRFDLYRAESVKIREILFAYTPLVEPLSLDEAYLDVSGQPRYAWDIAKEIRARIFAKTGLTGSAGIAPNKMLAKIASDWRKPNGQFAVLPDQVQEFMRDLPVRKIWGIGPKSAEKFAAIGIHKCGDLQQLSLHDMLHRHGKWGEELYHLCRGDDEREVEPGRLRKSLSNERTYTENLTTVEDCLRAIDDLVEELEEELRNKAADRVIRKAFVKIKFSDFTRTTRECVSTNPTRETYAELLRAAYLRSEQTVRLLGAGVRFAEEGAEGGDPQGFFNL
ncbi:MAG: DNA polymerase IV [Chthoniobacterales bacterium]